MKALPKPGGDRTEEDPCPVHLLWGGHNLKDSK
jgi:hypothetical protein